MNLWKEFSGPNAGYVLELYERFRVNPESVDVQARTFFQENAAFFEQETARSITDGSTARSQPAHSTARGELSPEKSAAVGTLAQAIRWYGHWAAQLDPLGVDQPSGGRPGGPPPGDPSLSLENYGLTEADLRATPASVVGGVAAQGQPSAWEAIEYLRKIYSGKVGHDYLQIRDPERRQWLREAAETNRFSVEQEPVDDLALLERLTEVEVFEHFLQRSFVAKTRFSIEGLDMLVPLLDEVIGCAAESGIYNILLGMAHRGRLNVLAHTLNKPIGQILAEFKDPLHRRVMQNEPEGWTGDVKYHAGARRLVNGNNGRSSDGQAGKTINLTIQMAPNPSHLEAVNPVVEGMARAAGTKVDQRGPGQFDPSVTLPILIHGDAAFPGQGVVAETLNLYQLKGYDTGGTIHVIANNQIGFTTSPAQLRSTAFASDLAKGYRVPILHVNADDPLGVVMAARLAFAYRARFSDDFLIDLIGYRRLGHNEGDEPSFTQPEMYQLIERHPSVRKQWAEQLVQSGKAPAGKPEEIYQARMQAMQSALDELDPETALQEPIPNAPPPGAAKKVNTAVPVEQLQALNQAIQQLPEGFTLNSRLAKIFQRRAGVVTDAFKDPDWPAIDWAKAEELALASILADGTPIRLTGQDVERGTFSHRHAVLHDARSGERYVPLQALPQAKAAFDIFNSPLSEYAALAFEFGYDVQGSERLTIWEAQYGDFINNAQAVVDEFIVSARDKWGQLNALVLLLPHGYEGQGPDHSSARLERFLNLTAENNMRVANCTTAANYFHLLRRQAALLPVDPLPLVVMTPKSLLRHPLVSSPLRAFSEGGWQPVIDRVPPPPRPDAPKDSPPPSLAPAENVRRLLVCSGKVYVDLVTSELQPEYPEVGVVRVEQLAPFPVQALKAVLERYPALESVTWVQEEPENMGAWSFARSGLEEAAGGRWPLRLVARPRSASPAEGSNNIHNYNQRRLMETAYTAEPERAGAQPAGSQKGKTGNGARGRNKSDNK